MNEDMAPFPKTLLAVDSASPLPGYAVCPPHEACRTGAPEGTRRINVLMLCDLFTLSYRVMRCFDAGETAVHVLGGPGSTGLRFSRFRRSYHRSRFGFAAPCDGVAEEVNAYIKELGIDLVLGGDHRSTRTLLALKPRLLAPCFPMPEPDQFDLLNDKWRFTQLCRRLGIRCPRSELVADRAELLRRLDSGEITMPFITKPLDLDGSRGVMLIKSREDIRIIESIGYHPILVQEYIEGDDIGASVYCDGGKIQASIVHQLKRSTYRTFHSAEIQGAMAKIVDATGVRGVLNFDMKIGRDGTVYWLECNPRVFYKMFLSMLAGINFASFGLPHATPELCASVPTGTNVRAFKAIAVELPRPWRLTSRDWAFVRYYWADPIPPIWEAYQRRFLGHWIEPYAAIVSDYGVVDRPHRLA